MNGKRVYFFNVVENVGCVSFEIKVHRRMILHFLCSFLIPKILSTVSPLSVLCLSSVPPSLYDVGRYARSLRSRAPLRHPIGLLSVYVWFSNCVRVLLVLVFPGSRNNPNYFTTFLKNLPQVEPKALKNNCFCYLCFAPFRFPKHSQIHEKSSQNQPKIIPKTS